MIFKFKLKPTPNKLPGKCGSDGFRCVSFPSYRFSACQEITRNQPFV